MNIKIIFLEDILINKFSIEAINEYNKNHKDIKVDYELYDKKETDKLYKYTLLNTFINIYEKNKNKFDYVVIINNNTTILDIQKYLEYLESLNFREKIFAFRILNIKGISLKYSPRIPYIDDSIITLNIQKAKEKSFFDRKLINGSHFYKYAKNQALLQSFIEYSLSNDEFINAINSDNIKDSYGKTSKNCFPFPFSYCQDSSIANVDINYDNRYVTLLTQIQKALNTGSSLSFFKENIIKSSIVNLIKGLNNILTKIQNKEFVKSFDEK